MFRGLLDHDPIPWLLSANADAITARVRRDLLAENVDLRALWTLPEPQRLLRRQQTNGSWPYPVEKPPPQNYDLYQTFVTLGELVGKYGFDRRHPAVQRAARYVFSCQTAAGDFRGIYGNQTAHTYTPALLEVLVDAGYGCAPEIRRAFRWLLATRQDDGGWAVATRTRDLKLVKDWDRIVAGPEIPADRTKPFSHLATGMVLRAFAAHPRYRRAGEALHAARLLEARLFKADKYSDRKGPAYWLKFTYPFQFTDLLTALDTLGKLGFPASDPNIARAIGWFRERQRSDGSFHLTMCRGIGDQRLAWWLGLALCRALLRFTARRKPDRRPPGARARQLG
jgi:GNAT superfamily N-acetyltransferase